jgi:hypothetical protein
VRPYLAARRAEARNETHQRRFASAPSSGRTA